MIANKMVYLYLDPRKPGHFTYNDRISFLFEPIYVGKGTKKRMYLYNEHRSPLIKNKLKKIGTPYRIVFARKLTEEEAFSLEKELIILIGRKILKEGPLCNISEGGEGCSGFIVSEETREKIRKGHLGFHHSEESKAKIKKWMNEHRIRKPKKPKKIKLFKIKPNPIINKRKVLNLSFDLMRFGVRKPHTKETKEKISLLAKNREKPNQITKNKISESLRKYWATEEAKTNRENFWKNTELKLVQHIIELHNKGKICQIFTGLNT